MISKIIQWISSIYNNVERWLFYGLILAVGIAGTWFTYNYAVQFSDYFIVLLFVTIFLAVFD